MDKKRNTMYSLSAMIPGDRFYFVGDRKKIIFQIREVEPFVQVKERGYWRRYGYCRIDGTLQTERHLADRRVIFLRNIYDNTGQNTNQETTGHPEAG